MSHAKFNPSAAKQWIACPASWVHNLPVEGELEPSSEAAKEGTIAHAIAEFALEKSINPTSLIGQKIVVEIDGEESHCPIEKEMAEYVAVYTDHCETLAMLSDRRLIETQVHVPLDVHSKPTRDLLWGTADFISIADGTRIDVVDLKYGMLPVEPENNPQAVAYLMGALELCGDKLPESAAVHIVQPRLSKEPAVWEIHDVEGLVAEWKPRFEQAIMRAKEAAALANPLATHYNAGEHCRFCNVITSCGAFAKRMIDIAKSELEELESGDTMAQMASLDLMLLRWENKSLVTRYYSELEKALKKAIYNGKQIPGYKIVMAQGNRQWTLNSDAMAPKFRAQGLKKPDFVTEKIKSPAQIEKLLDNPRFFEKFTTRKASGEKLVPISDKREAINPKVEMEVLPVPPPKPKTKKSNNPTMDLIELGELEDKQDGNEDTTDLIVETVDPLTTEVVDLLS